MPLYMSSDYINTSNFKNRLKIYLPAGRHEAPICRYFFTQRPIFRYFAPQGRHVKPIKVKFGRENWAVPVKFYLNRLRGVRLRPQNSENLEYYQYNCPYGASALHDSYKIYGVYAHP